MWTKTLAPMLPSFYHPGQYTLLPLGADDYDDSLDPPSYSIYTRFSQRLRCIFSKLRCRTLTLIIFSITALLLVAGTWIATSRKSSVTVQWDPDVFKFENPKPAYLDAPVPASLIIRLAIISRPEGFEKRQALREAMLKGVPSTHVQLDYKFFVARAESLIKRLKVAKEKLHYGDIEVLGSIRDVPGRISEKRFAALKWTANSVQYDYSMTMDSDTFCRLRALSQRLRYVYADIKPQTEPVLFGSMASQHVYYINTVPDGNPDDNEEDSYVTGPWYSYPAGIGYLMSSNLSTTMANLDPPLPHHINYPSDDVMVGSWVAGLRYLPDATQQFESSPDNSDEPVHRVYPEPYLPYIINASTVDDKVGWHDLKGRGGAQRPIGWDSVCIHRVQPNEMRALRAKEEFRGEWDN